MSTELILIILLLLVGGGLLFLAIKYGKGKEALSTLAKILKIKKKQDRAAKKSPRTKKGISDSLKKGDF